MKYLGTFQNRNGSDVSVNGHTHTTTDFADLKCNLVNTDANAITISGFYHCITNIPTIDGETDKSIIHNQYGGSVSWATQIAISWRNGRMWFRNKENGVWENWIEVAKILDIPTKLSQLTNDIGAGGIKITVDSTAPTSTAAGDFWYKVV
jgi:hypothetical protein